MHLPIAQKGFADTLATLASMIEIPEALFNHSWCNRQGHLPTVLPYKLDKMRMVMIRQGMLTYGLYFLNM